MQNRIDRQQMGNKTYQIETAYRYFYFLVISCFHIYLM